jgi:hypothetical protein
MEASLNNYVPQDSSSTGVSGTSYASDASPSGLSPAEFKSICVEVGGWLWGTVQGAFNEKATLNQIIVDAVIGMIPLLGDVTAVRDLIAVTIGLIDDPEKRESKWEWVMLVVFVLALIPVFGGIAKGVGRIVVTAAKEAEKLTGVARTLRLEQGAQDILEFLDRMGHKNAGVWFKKLNFKQYLPDVMNKFRALMDGIAGVLEKAKDKMAKVLPASVIARMNQLIEGLKKLKVKGEEMIPESIKELDRFLSELQTYVHNGGSLKKKEKYEAAVGARNLSRVEEARLVEHPEYLPVVTRHGGFAKNTAVEGQETQIKNIYEPRPQDGYPDLTSRATNGHYTAVEAFSGKMVNRGLQFSDGKIYRFFGPQGTTRRFDVGGSSAKGVWWGVGEPPKSAKEWREKCAVLDEWNRDGYIVEGIPPKSPAKGQKGVKGVFGTISEQFSENIPGQYLPGGNTQAFLNVPESVSKEIDMASKEVMKTNKPVTPWTNMETGITFTIRPTGWKDTNGIHGYVSLTPESGKVAVVRVGHNEEARKDNEEVFIK